MIEIIQSDRFKAWWSSLRDAQAQQRIVVRIRRMSLGNLGDAKPVGDGVSEARIDYGPGYRLYFLQQDQRVIVLLCGGHKGSQERDIRVAKQLADQWR